MENEKIYELFRRIDYIFSKPRKSKNQLYEIKDYVNYILNYLYNELNSSRFANPTLFRKVQFLRHKLRQAISIEQIQYLVREIQQIYISLSSTEQNNEIVSRVREIEGQLKLISSNVNSTANETVNEEEKIITIDKLKGKRVLFAIMPFSEEFSDVWIGGIQRAASGTGLSPIRIDSITISSEITDDIIAAIEIAEIIVIDVTRNNPNVMFEFGFALAKKKPRIVISQSTEFLTFDIKNVRSIIYQNSWKGIEKLHKDLQTFIKGTVKNKPKKRKKNKTSKE